MPKINHNPIRAVQEGTALYARCSCGWTGPGRDLGDRLAIQGTALKATNADMACHAQAEQERAREARRAMDRIMDI